MNIKITRFALTAVLWIGLLEATRAVNTYYVATNQQPNRERKPGEKIDITVYANAEDYASFPQLARTDNELVLLFQVQNLAKLRAVAVHPHYQKVAVPRWATSRDGGLTWKIHDTCPPLGHVQEISYGSAPLADGGTVTLTYGPLHAIIQHGRIGYRPHQDEKAETGEIHTVTNLGPFSRFVPHGMTRTADGKIIAAGQVPFKKAPDGSRDTTTVAFLASADEGRTWRYLSHIPNETMFDFCEPAILPTKDGRLLVVVRIEGDRKIIVKDMRPAEARHEMGYFLYQAESADGGRTWTDPVQLPIWGHPPYLTRLASGNILLVYGHRRKPYEIRAVLSRDEGRTWDLTTLCTIHCFEPGDYDLGYPVATQCPDGTIVCAYYGYSTENVGENMPHGIFVSVFDEAWLCRSSLDRINLSKSQEPAEIISYYVTKPVNWGLEAPQLYLDYRLRMNYDADPKKVLVDFYSGFYGPAAGAMQAFYEFVDAAQTTPIQGEKNAANRYLSQWPVGKAEQALKLLDQADAAAGNDPIIKGRIELSRVSIGYIRENSRCFELERKYKQSNKLEDFEALAKACAERETWLDGILKKQEDGYYTKTLGLINPFPGNYRQGELRDQVVYGKNMAGHGLRGGPFDTDFKSKLAFLRQHPKIEGNALKADGAPKIDGILDEAVWAKAPKMGMLKDDGSAAASVPTDIQLAYDQNAVYVAFTVHEPAIDKMEKKPAEVAKKERAELEDCVEVFLGESGKDARKWVHLIVSFTNARYDGRFGFVTDPLDPLSSKPDSGWTAPWESAVKVDAEKKQWTVEMAIPWSTLGFGAPQAGTCLQANFARERWTDQGPKGATDISAWSPTFGKGLEDASRFGAVKLDN